MEPWDGPAAVAFSDGRQIGATLDRNGLRPARYIVTDDDLVIMASEAGVLPIPEEKIVKKWRLQPGKMFLIDVERGRIIDDKELKDTLAAAKPYREWIERIRIRLDDVESDKQQPGRSEVPLLDRQQAFGYTQEELKFLMLPMAAAGEEAVGSMGNDSPLAVLSSKNKTLYHYFKQLFAQVTNPPIDPIREELVMSLVSFIGPKPNLLGIDEINPPIRLEVSQPVLDFYEMDKIRHIDRNTEGKFKSFELDITYPVAWGHEAIEARLASLCAQAEDAVRSGYSDHHHLRPPRRPRPRLYPGAAGALGRCTSIWWPRACAPAPAWSLKPARRARCIISRCSRVTARKRCIPISRSSPCSTCRTCCPRASTAARRSGISSRRSARGC